MTSKARSAIQCAVEALMREKYETEPFHNLRLLPAMRHIAGLAGGTCSDKTLSFVQAARAAGFDVALHSGAIGGREIHRLARLRIEGATFFADVGNGWPALKLYPADRPISVRCFGMRFRTEIHGSRVVVFHEREGIEARQLEIDIRPRTEDEIRADIAGRFTTGIEYPFSRSLRVALIVQDRFLFLRGERLEIHTDHGVEIVDGIAQDRVPSVLRDAFRLDVSPDSSQPSPLL